MMMNSTTTTEQKNDAPPKDAPKQQAAPAVQAPMVVAGDDPSRMLSAFASDRAFVIGQRMALALSRSSLMPKAYQGEENIPNVLIAMELANRIGASVFMVAQNLDIIHGRPGWRSQFLIATVNASRRFTPLRFRWSGKEGSDDWGCRAYAKDAETGEECLGALITIRMAKAEGWYQRNGSKWLTMPEQMTMYRAAAFWTRVYCPELALGINTTEEVQDMTIDAIPVQAAPAAELEAQIRAQPSPSPAATSAPPVPAKPAPRDFDAEAVALRTKLSAEYDAATGDGEKMAPVKLAELRADVERFCDGAPEAMREQAWQFWTFLTGDKR